MRRREVISHAPVIDDRNARGRISAIVAMPDGEEEVWFEGPADHLADRTAADAFAQAALFPAMRAADHLVFEAPISPAMRANLEHLQDVLTMWWPDRLKRVTIDADELDPPPDRGSQTAAFFSGGVDSFYTALTQRDRIDALILVHGFDIALEDAPLRQAASRHLRDAAGDMGLDLVEVATNLRDFSTPYAHWLEDFHGAALASVGHALGGTFGHALIAAAILRERPGPHGLHPVIVPMLGSDRIDFEVPDEGVPRLDKITHISTHDVALRHLRVCWETPGAYNCGTCSKCIGTKVGFLLAGLPGSSDRLSTFDSSISLDAVADIRIRRGTHNLALGNYERAVKIGADADLVSALRAPLDRMEVDEASERISADLALALVSPAAADLVSEHRDLLFATLWGRHPGWTLRRAAVDLPRKALRKLVSLARRRR